MTIQINTDFNPECPACQEMRELGLTFEETHSGYDGAEYLRKFH